MGTSWLLGLWCISSAWAWPADDEWRVINRAGNPVTDAVGDGTGPLDLTPDDRGILAEWGGDEDGVYFRIHVASDPRLATGDLKSWGVMLDVDGDEAADFMIAAPYLQAAQLVVIAYERVGDWTGVTSEQTWNSTSTVQQGALVTVDATGAWIAFHLTLAEFNAISFGLDTPTRYLPVTHDAQIEIEPGTPHDVAGCSTACDTLQAVVSGPITIDADLDGVPYPLEARRGSDPNDPDTDDDGLRDDVDPDPVSCDADGDGVLDSVEVGLTQIPDFTTPGICFQADADPATTTDPLVVDSDGGGLDDGQEDRNGNGRLDAWESDPTVSDDDADEDGDGLADVVELRTDGGGIDVDGDEIPDVRDPDSDNDGIPDGVEGVSDPDLDGLPAFRDLDADGDTILDKDDGESDVDQDGLPAFLDIDADNDTIEDGIEGIKDYDRDGEPNFLDVDADGDEILDEVEGTADLDCDGRPDFLDVIDDDGFCDTDLPRGAVDDGPFDGRAEPPTSATPDDFDDVGCASVPSGGAAAGLWLGVLAFGARRRRSG